MALALVVPDFAASAGETWPQWRGPTRDGKVDGDDWPATLTLDGLKRVWSAEVAEGYSGPLVTADSVITVETRDEKDEIVRAFARADGKPLWSASWEGSMKVPFFARKNGSWVRSTPAYADGRLYVGGMRDVLVCLDAGDGKEKWRVDFPTQEGTNIPSFGFVCSPLVVDDGVIVQAGLAVAKLDKETGSTRWRTLEDGREMFGSAFSSPTLEKLGGREQLLVQTRSDLAGVDRATGEVLWKYPVKAFRGMNILTPTRLASGGVFTSSYGGGSFLFTVTGESSGVLTEKAWTNPFEGYMSSPIAIGDMIYLHGRNKKFCCIDGRDGSIRWETDETFGEYWSMVANGDRILALDERGELLLIRANPEKFELLGRAKVSERPTWAHLAACGRELFIRDLTGITAWRWEG